MYKYFCDNALTTYTILQGTGSSSHCPNPSYTPGAALLQAGTAMKTEVPSPPFHRVRTPSQVRLQEH